MLYKKRPLCVCVCVRACVCLRVRVRVLYKIMGCSCSFNQSGIGQHIISHRLILRDVFINIFLTNVSGTRRLQMLHQMQGVCQD